ncbi:MAG: ergothioneine biosynthesis protein EgtB [Schleiferiaceae bacterium]
MSQGMSLISHYKAVRQKTESICSPLEIEDYVIQPDEFVSPPKWHLAHTTWFFETFVLSIEDDYTVHDTDFSFLFNSYYNHVGQRTIRYERGHITRPTVSEVYAYRKYVDTEVEKRFKGFNEEQLSRLALGLQHEQQHQELLWYDIHYSLSKNPLYPKYKSADPLHIEPTDEYEKWLSFDRTLTTIGHQSDGFCFDNEKGVHEALILPFEICTELVTNDQFLEFIDDGGYQRFEFWLAEAWDWVQRENISKPLYWNQHNDQWHQFTLGGNIPLIGDEPLRCISYFEADAYARWRGCRLPTEFEWELASPQLDHGKVWEWTQSAYTAYPGFTIAEGALGEYNGKFMVNQKVLRGGSVASPENHIRPTYRNFFHPHLQWMYSGIRLAR